MFGKKDFSRRDLLKLALVGLGTAFLAACERLVKSISMPAPANADNPQPAATDTPAPTETSTPTQPACFRLLAPENGATLGSIGKVTFSWEAMPGAARYRLEITLPTGTVLPFESGTTGHVRYLESLPLGGTFNWQVTALDAGGGAICLSEPFTFGKPEYIPRHKGSDTDPGAINDINTISDT